MCVVEPLESRRHLAGDLGVSVQPSSFPTVLVEGIRPRGGAVVAQVRNVGDTAFARSARTEVRLVLAGSGDVADRVLATRPVRVGGLASSGVRRVSLAVQLPRGLGVGIYQLRAEVNPSGTLAEGSTSNNSVIIGQVIVETVRADVFVSATSNLASTPAGIAPGTRGRVRVTLANGGTVPLRAVGRVEIVAATGGREQVLPVVPSVSASLPAPTRGASEGGSRPGRVFSLRPVEVRIPAVSQTGEPPVETTLLARFIPSTLPSAALRGENPANNSAAAGTLSVTSPSASVLGSAGFGQRLALRATGLTPDGSGGTIERGGFVDAAYGRAGTYELRLTPLGGSGGGANRLRSGPLTLRDAAGGVVLSVRLTVREGVLRGGRVGGGAGVLEFGGQVDSGDGDVLVGGVVVGVRVIGR